MAYVNMAAIQKKVASYAKSKEGKKRIDERIEEIRHSGDGRTASGDYVTTINDMRAATRLMKAEVIHSAQIAGLPDSVMDHIDVDPMGMSEPVDLGRNRYYTSITFADGARYKLFRPSLEIVKNGSPTGKKTGEGVDNIVALFNNGYDADKQVFGLWAGHEDLGIVGSRMSRKGLLFMQDAVRNFNRKYGGAYNVTATLDDIYESGYSIGGEE